MGQQINTTVLVIDDRPFKAGAERANSTFATIQQAGSKAAKAIGDGVSAVHAGILRGIGGVEKAARNVTRISDEIRTAFRTMASKTGCASLGELLITRRISDVAACCSSDSASLTSNWTRDSPAG